MSKVRKSLSAPEILRRDPYAFVDRHHDPRNVHLTDILFARERGSPSSSEEIMRDLLPVSESLVISRSSSSSEEMLWDLFPRYESPASSPSSSKETSLDFSPWKSALFGVEWSGDLSTSLSPLPSTAPTLHSDLALSSSSASSEEMLWDLYFWDYSTKVSTQGPWRFETEGTQAMRSGVNILWKFGIQISI